MLSIAPSARKKLVEVAGIEPASVSVQSWCRPIATLPPYFQKDGQGSIRGRRRSIHTLRVLSVRTPDRIAGASNRSDDPCATVVDLSGLEPLTSTLRTSRFSQLNYRPEMDHSVGVEPTTRCFAGICLTARPAVDERRGTFEHPRTAGERLAAYAVAYYGADSRIRTEHSQAGNLMSYRWTIPALVLSEGFEPPLSRFVAERLVRWTTRAKIACLRASCRPTFRGTRRSLLERTTRLERASAGWKPTVLPLNDIRSRTLAIQLSKSTCRQARWRLRSRRRLTLPSLYPAVAFGGLATHQRLFQRASRHETGDRGRNRTASTGFGDQWATIALTAVRTLRGG